VLNFGLVGFAGDPVQMLMDPQKRASLPDAAVEQLTAAVAGALHHVFLAAASLGVLAFLAAWLVPTGLRPGHDMKAQARSGALPLNPAKGGALGTPGSRHQRPIG